MCPHCKGLPLCKIELYWGYKVWLPNIGRTPIESQYDGLALGLTPGLNPACSKPSLVSSQFYRASSTTYIGSDVPYATPPIPPKPLHYSKRRGKTSPLWDEPASVATSFSAQTKFPWWHFARLYRHWKYFGKVTSARGRILCWLLDAAFPSCHLGNFNRHWTSIRPCTHKFNAMPILKFFSLSVSFEQDDVDVRYCAGALPLELA